MKFISLVILLLLTANAAFPQHFQSRVYTGQDGLSNNDTRCVLADPEGFLWIGTTSGLNRFDGNAFENFYNNPADSNSIADNSIQKLFLDAANRLWIGTNAGISLYHTGTRSFSNYAPDTMVLKQQGISYGAICDDNENNIWVGTKNDLLIFNTGKQQFSSSGWRAFAETRVQASSNHLRVVVLSLAKKNKDELWILSTYGLFSVITKTKKFLYYPYPAINDYFGYSLDYTDSYGNVWIGSYYNGIYCFNGNTGEWTNYLAPQKKPFIFGSKSILQYDGDTILYCNGNELQLFDVKQKKILAKLDYYDSVTASRLVDAAGQSIIRHQNMFWLGTNKGLVKIVPVANQFRFVALTPGDETGRVFSLDNQHDFLFTGVHGNYTTYLKRKDNPAIPVMNVKKELLHIGYQYFVEGKDGIGYLNDDEHFYEYNNNTNTAIPIALPVKANLQNDFSIRNMVEDRDGNVWIRSLEQGILKYEPATRTIALADYLPHQANKEINALYYDSLSHTIWYAEEFNGIYRYDITRKQVAHYRLNKPSLQRNAAVVYISGDGKGTIWLIDLQAGLIEYNISGNSFRRFTVADGLPSNNLLCSVYDFNGSLWINTDKGLCRYVPAFKKFISYRESEALPFTPAAFLSADKDGNIYMPYKNGYCTWNVNALQDPVKGGKIYLRDAMLFNNHLASETSYSFLHNENNIQFLFGLLSFDNRDMIRIEYSLNGNPWVTNDIHSYISFANLAPGKYKLNIKIKNENITPLQIIFDIAKPFWQQWWFIILFAIAAAAGIASISRMRMKRFKKESFLQQKLVESKLSALRSQMNPHFIFNTLNSINSYIIENKKDEASDYLTDFSRLIRIILEHSQKKSVPLADEIKALKLYLELESKRLEAAFDYSIKIIEAVDMDTVSIPPLIIQPFVENAIWHGLRGKKTGGHIDIIIQPYNNGILIIVQDDGVGRVASSSVQKFKNNNSFGSDATQQRILMNEPGAKVEIEDLYDNDGKASGTRVNIFLHQNAN